MGIRFYPRTNKPAALELICGVSKGTSVILQGLEDAFKPLLDACGSYGERNEIEERKFNIIAADDDVNKLHHFHLFGWGRFDWSLTGEEYAGTVKPEDERTVLAHHGVYLTDEQLTACEGLCWN